MSEEINNFLNPSLSYIYSLKIYDRVLPFQEMIGLNVGDPIIEYRNVGSMKIGSDNYPKPKKETTVTLKNIVFFKYSKYEFDEVYKELFLFGADNNILIRKNVTITLLDENRNPAIIWELKNAFATKILGVDSLNEENKVLGSVEFVFEDCTINVIGNQ